jgi:hypothetical protein
MSNAKVKKGRVEVVTVPNEPPPPPEAATSESEEARAERERLSSEKLPEQPYLEIPPSDEALKELCPEGKDFKEFKAWYKSLDKLNVLKDAIELQKQNIELTGETQRLKADVEKLQAAIAEKDVVIGNIDAQVATLIAATESVKPRDGIDMIRLAKDRSYYNEVVSRKSGDDAWREQIDSLAARGQTLIAIENANLVEIVALPPNPDVKVFPLTYKGEKMKMEKDEDGFYHFWVPRKLAESLLGSASGMRYALVGPDDKMTVKRFESSRAVDITVYKHVKAQYPTGGAFWQPVIEEESGNGDS